MLTFDLAHSIMRFMEARSEAREAYLLTCRRLEQAKGSQLYSDGMKAASDKRAATVEAAQARARAAVRQILSEMRANAAKIQVDAPTPEQLAILQAVKMRDGISSEALEEIAASLDGNALALGVLDDIARKNGLYFNFTGTRSRKLSRAAVEGIINDVQRETEKIINDPVGVAPAAAIYANNRRTMYNDVLDLDNLPQVPEYRDEFELLEALGVPDFNLFESAVGGGQHNG